MPIKRSYYHNSIIDFTNEETSSIIGKLSQEHRFDLTQNQTKAWRDQIVNLKENLSCFTHGEIFFEFQIPRMGRRADNIILIDDTIFVIEYKTGNQTADSNSIDQTVNYALDLKYFHEGSHDKTIIPILISASSNPNTHTPKLGSDNVSDVIISNFSELKKILIQNKNRQENNNTDYHDNQLSQNKQSTFQFRNWSEYGYKPTPTIIEAARALYSGHDVAEISRSDAGAINIERTSRRIESIIQYSKINNQKSICLVTGVPGAGKTLVGLNLTTSSDSKSSTEGAVFLSGNGPLVSVLREALARDEYQKCKFSNAKISKKDAERKVSSIIQNIHEFRDEGLSSTQPPYERVVIFDEAQRAWDRKQTNKFMSAKRGQSDFNMSEPDFLISLMDRHSGWCVIICLIGEGQEINSGEAGISEWVDALGNNFQHWNIYCSTRCLQKFEDHTKNRYNINFTDKLKKEEYLHLNTSMRSFRSENVSLFVSKVIEGGSLSALDVINNIRDYKIRITRNLDRAKRWLNDKQRGLERIGLVASSGAIRLKAHGLHVKNSIDPANWFLNESSDIRSSNYLEDIATEFDIQGLELDWIGMCWDGDLRFSNGAWSHFRFRGTNWQRIRDESQQVYLENAYRVLLTRARQGMVIFIPEGSTSDGTRSAEFYDGTYDFLISCGIKSID